MTEVRAEITANVWQVHVEAGQDVAEGDTIVILESMKMEMPVEAPSSGTIQSIKIKEGDPVTEGAVLAVLT